MKYVTMTIPEDPKDLPGWLETAVARGQAKRLATELAAANGSKLTTGTSGDFFAAVRQRGFSGLNDKQIQTVLKNPSVLIALAEDVFVNGGPYWNQRLAEETLLDDRVDAGWEKLKGMLPAAPVTPAKAERKRSFAPWIASLATAAALMLAVYTMPGLRSALTPGGQTLASSGWGWQKADELKAIAKPADYLDRVAALAGEWSKQDTSNAAALASRINEFRQGCTKLQLMEHKALNEEQRKDLLARCQKWAKKFDESLIALETTGDTAKARADMDATVATLTKVLRDQAAALRG